MKREDIAKGLGIGALVALAAYAVSRLRPGERPPPPAPPPGPQPGMATLYGSVFDAVTRLPIEGAKVLLDLDQAFTGPDGSYLLENLEPYAYTVNISREGYETAIYTVELAAGDVREVSVYLKPTTPPPTEWSENVTVESMSVDSPVYVGETARIRCYIQYWHPAPLPATIYGTVKVNGEEIKGSWYIRFRNPTVGFDYPATTPGVYTAIAQDKSATFEVVESIVKPYYSPVGGIKMPVPVKWHTPDGSVYDRYTGFGVPPNAFKTSETEGYATWKPAGVHVTDWIVHFNPRRFGGLFSYKDCISVIPLKWTGCPHYWDNKDDLCKMLSASIAYGTTKFDIDGEIIPQHRTGYLYAYDPTAQLAFWARRLGRGTNPPVNLGYFQQYVSCPYCSHKEYGPMQHHGHQIGPVVRAMVEHIEQAHPRYLNEPNYGEWEYATCPNCNGTGCWRCGGDGLRWQPVHKWGLPEFQE